MQRLKNMVIEVSKLLNDRQAYQSMHKALTELAPMLSEDSEELACDAIEHLLAGKLVSSAKRVQ